MDEAVRELLRSAEAGAKPDLRTIKEKVKDNLSLKKRIEDLEKFVIAHSEGEELENLIAFLEEIREEIERGRRILYSPFTTSKLITNYEVVSLLQEAGLNASELTREDWASLYEVIDELNEVLENRIKEELKEPLKALVKFFLKRLEAGEPIKYAVKQKGVVKEGFYPAADRPLAVVDLYPNRVLLNLIRRAIAKLNAADRLEALSEVEVFFNGVSAKLGDLALTAVARKVFNLVAKALLKKADYDREEEIKRLLETLSAGWRGEYRVESSQTQRDEGEEIVDIEGFEDLI
jgi:hypothetical protein